MQISFCEMSKRRSRADLIVIPFWQEKKKAVAAAAGIQEFSSLVALPLKEGDFHGKEGETLLLYRQGGKEKRVMLLGLGAKKSAVVDTFRNAYASSVKLCLHKKVREVNFLLPDVESIEPEVVAKAVCEGILLSNYAFDQLKSQVLKEDPHHLLAKGCLIGYPKEQMAFLKKTSQVISAVHYVRDLVNRNGDDVTPQALILEAKLLEKQFSAITTSVLDKEKLEKEKMGLLLAVGKGAAREPALVLIEYKGDPDSKALTAIVGKGITYDTGGLNLKPTGSMETMKCDMAGAAATLGLMRAAAAIGLKRNLIGVLATAENAIGSMSYKPGDVFLGRAGISVEIANTDAEGRLVLADAISYVQDKYRLTRMIDMATLTGGIVIALGEEASGLFSNNDVLAKALVKAGDVTHERVWRMPVYREYKESLKSQIADIKNVGGRKASAGTAALFLQQFVKQVPWAHLDIAGTAYLSDPRSYHPTHATGVGVRLLIEFLENLHEE
jgi:leucyl aminopeptidase